MKKLLKTAAGRLWLESGTARSRMRNKAVVVLFHRVDDSLRPNPCTCTESFFRAFCRLAQRHFSVISLGELLDRIAADEDVGGRMVITFDDGYEDNLTHAAPILAEFGLPACFFLATGFIETSYVPWWDEAWGTASRWMTWDQVRQLRLLGHEIGAHTCHHVDLSEVHGKEARAEIENSKKVLEDQLGEAINLFSYPYGRKEQITEGNRDMVRQLGFRCCPSAYGGVVRPGQDPFYLLREPISPWYRAPYQFAFEFLL